MVLHYDEQTCEEIFSSKQFIDSFNKRYTNDNKQKLIYFLDNIETNKKYYKMGIHKNKKFKRVENNDTLIIKEINSILNKLTYENKNYNINQIINILEKQFLTYIIENVIQKSLLHHIYIELYVDLINQIKDKFDINILLNKIIDETYNSLMNEKNNDKTYDSLIKKNDNLDKLSGLGILISSLEKQHNIKNNSYNIVSDLIKNIDYEDKDNLYKKVICIFNIIKVNTNLRDNFYDELNDIKSNNIPSKIKFKIMDIFDI